MERDLDVSFTEACEERGVLLLFANFTKRCGKHLLATMIIQGQMTSLSYSIHSSGESAVHA